VKRNLPFLREQYLAYLEDFSRCATYRSLRPHGVHARVLNKLYEQSPACLAYLGELRERANEKLAVCPYCGLPGRLTLDHYLPRDVRAFPHLSIFSFNLVPSCDACQRAKGNLAPVLRRRGILATRRSGNRPLARTGRMAATASARAQARHERVAGRRQPERLLHPYFDAFLGKPVWQFVPLDVAQPFETLTLASVPSSGRHEALVRHHIKVLHLEVRGLREVAHMLRFAIQSFRDRAIANPVDAATEAGILLRSALSKTKTPNSVDCTFLRAVRDLPPLADDVLQRALQAPPGLVLCSQGVKF